MADNHTDYIWLDEAMSQAHERIRSVRGFEEVFPHLDTLLGAVLESVALRFDSADDELGRLTTIAGLHSHVDSALADHVRLCRELLGYSWTDVAKALGVSRQAARLRFASDVDLDTPEMERLDAEAEFVLAKMRLEAKQHALDGNTQAATVTVDSTDLERLLEIGREKRQLAQEALDDMSDDDVARTLRRRSR
jgi:hypothetical protein